MNFQTTSRTLKSVGIQPVPVSQTVSSVDRHNSDKALRTQTREARSALAKADKKQETRGDSPTQVRGDTASSSDAKLPTSQSSIKSSVQFSEMAKLIRSDPIHAQAQTLDSPGSHSKLSDAPSHRATELGLSLTPPSRGLTVNFQAKPGRLEPSRATDMGPRLNLEKAGVMGLAAAGTVAAFALLHGAKRIPGSSTMKARLLTRGQKPSEPVSKILGGWVKDQVAGIRDKLPRMTVLTGYNAKLSQVEELNTSISRLGLQNSSNTKKIENLTLMRDQLVEKVNGIYRENFHRKGNAITNIDNLPFDNKGQIQNVPEALGKALMKEHRWPKDAARNFTFKYPELVRRIEGLKKEGIDFEFAHNNKGSYFDVYDKYIRIGPKVKYMEQVDRVAYDLTH
jgi:hypothetical protein